MKCELKLTESDKAREAMEDNRKMKLEIRKLQACLRLLTVRI